ncbi:uncharacterized protein N7473_002269 [Penicillium subrubescens]|uniref:uncharacterized protein n=1 Tax=Penicillium subrubescens TaxID=1316194 RepID=UPI002545B50A|nr:uncharacterized protein N7473_002269 [Penicillium subrubescens]KAJ5905353.1 hypothetical protein N7473_002269 [Penicillium subrubescens]
MSSYSILIDKGNFLVDPGHMGRIEGPTLRKMFLPRITREGQKAISQNSHFVRCQLKHYGVEFEEKEFSGNGTALLKKALQAGKCDQVPDPIRQLERQMYTKFINERTHDELVDYPDWAMNKYFLSFGYPDHTKTTTVVGLVVGQTDTFFSASEHTSDIRLWKISDAASKIPKLHYEKAMGAETRAIYLGWDAAAVEKAASEHVASQWKAPLDDFDESDEDDKRERARKKLHTDYLNAIAQSKSQNKAVRGPSPIGSYIVDSQYYKKQWRSGADDLRLDIHKTDTPGVFQANFEFGVHEGIMMIGVQKDVLEEHCLEADRQTVFSDDEEEYDSESEGRTLASGSKRKASGTPGTKKAKKQQSESTNSLKYQLKMRCRETGEGEIQAATTDGSLEFDNETLVRFVGEATIPLWSNEKFSFTACKISNRPSPAEKDWGHYSERRHDYEWARRWY